LQKYNPETIDTASIHTIIEQLKKSKELTINNTSLYFNPQEHIIFKRVALPFHPNGILFKAHLENGDLIEEKYYSIGGGFIVTENEADNSENPINFPYPVETEADLLKHMKATGKSIADIVLANECYLQDKDAVYKKLTRIWEGVLPGGLKVKRRAQLLNQKLIGAASYNDAQSWVKVIQNSPNNFEQVNNWILLIASEIGSIFKKGATISAAAGGCQAEIGVSSSMAAAALTELQGGSPQQALMAAEIAMEHHLGLTCDPIKGLVQVPCIERNSMGAIKAITASNLEKYKETAEGGLAINVSVGLAEC